MGLFTKGGSAVVEADELIRLDDLPSIKAARDAVLAARQKEAEAQQALAAFSSDEISLGRLSARDAFQNSGKKVKEAEALLAGIRDEERERIRAARLPGERELRWSIVESLKEARNRRAILESYKADTDRLAQGRWNCGIDVSHDWPELEDLDGWVERNQREGLL